MFIFDTDTLTHDQNGHTRLRAKIRSTPRQHLFTTSITLEEQLKRRLAYLNQYRYTPHKSAQGHAALIQTVRYFQAWNILLFNEEADAIFRQIQKRRIRVGAQDLRIAATALLHGFVVVTVNVHDFVQVPDLKVEDWTSPSSV